MIYKSLIEHVGNTPLLEIPFEVHKIKNLNLYAKLELFNPWGSVKDRTAYGMLKPAIKSGALLENRIIESSSSNTAKALQALALLNGTSVKTITNRIKVQEQRDILTLLGTEIVELPGKSECPDPNDPNNPQIIIEREIKNSNETYTYTDQYNNKENRKIHYETTAKEILDDLGTVDFIFGGLGTTGSIGGISQKMREENESFKSVGIVSSKTDFIPGIRNSEEVLEVGLFDPKEYQEIVSIASDQAVDESLALIRKVALFAGPTSGASLAGVKQYFKNIKLDEPKNAVFIACDRAENYISYYKERRPDIFGLRKKQDWNDNLNIVEDAQVTEKEVTELVKEKEVLIVDLRSSISFKVAHIPNSINIPAEKLNEMLNDGSIPFSKSQKILLICAVGEKSLAFASFLRAKGFEANSLYGGMVTWRDNNFTLEKGTL